MGSIKVVLRKKKNAKGLFPIMVRITKDRKSSYLSTGQYVDEKFWDEKNQKVKKAHPNSTRLNNFIIKKLAEANDKLLELESTQDGITAQVVTNQIKSRNKVTTFFNFARVYIDQLEKKGQYNRVCAEKPRIKHFRVFLKNKDISFPEITEVLLKKFQAYLKATRKVSDRTIVNYLIVIRTIYNLAIREGIIDRKHYPFGKGRIVIRFPQSVKLGLSMEEVNALEKINLNIEQENYARNVWLLSFYFAGMRVSDVLRLKWSDFKDERLYYQMGKNKKVLSLKVPEKATKILAQYESDKSSDNDFVFPSLVGTNLNNEYDINQKIANGNRLINKYLKRIAKKLALDKPLTMHIARHTFGNISGDKIPIQMLQQLYRHSDITTTINYQKNFIFKDADDALDKVLGS
ncbi:MAG: phage integrase SAM-like domain-containing protein [Lewinellaceae bacterium]|nr:phage integrase SAM-like domain-containing protein [Lewinellaceae bacterium]